MLTLRIDTTNIPALDRFPEYVDPLDDPLFTMASNMSKSGPLGRLQSDDDVSSRGASPQPTHFSVPLKSHNNGSGHRILRSATVGYVAPEFKGKVEQMATGNDSVPLIT
jgi:glutamate dehydrogenase